MTESRPGNAIEVSTRPLPTTAVRTEEEYVSWTAFAGLLRRRWPILLLTVLVTVGAAVAYVALTPPVYEAQTSLLLDQESYNLPELVTKDEGQSTNDVTTQVQVLRSSQLSDEVVRELGLRLSVLTPDDQPRSRLLQGVAIGEQVDTARLALARIDSVRFAVVGIDATTQLDTVVVGQPATIAGVTFTLRPEAARHEELELRVGSLAEASRALQDELKVFRPDRNGNVVSVQFRSGDAGLAGRVPNLVAEHYLAGRLDRARAKVRSAVEFLQHEADTLRAQLKDAEVDLRQYREKEDIVSLPDEATSSVLKADELRAGRAKLDAERSALEKLVKEADAADEGASPYRRLTAFPTLIGNPVVADLLQTLTTLQSAADQAPPPADAQGSRRDRQSGADRRRGPAAPRSHPHLSRRAHQSGRLARSGDRLLHRPGGADSGAGDGGGASSPGDPRCWPTCTRWSRPGSRRPGSPRTPPIPG